ncbi:F-box domain containing protein [Musa troglodytarum]|uniref:F-box domain containing protein n=1 Tax=Musa troglodytarum TaxID=320322 RepID=A0A9E7HLC0_9LILI|nr:F-box domain containing protein [Musa troglodytarum]
MKLSPSLFGSRAYRTETSPFGLEMEKGGGSSRFDLGSSSLPCDLALDIVSLLEASDVCSLGSCSRFWQDICASDSVWIALYKRRWPSAVGDLGALPSQGCKTFYINKHKKLASAVSDVIKSVLEWSKSGSMEVGYYLKAISDLGSMELGFKDVQLFLFRREHNVLLNLIGLHYCIFSLDIPVSIIFIHSGSNFLLHDPVNLTLQSVDVMEVLESCQVSEQQVCVSWFMLGRWFYGFRLPDEHRSRIVSLTELAMGKEGEVLGVLNRGAIHEVLRVQITTVATSTA